MSRSDTALYIVSCLFVRSFATSAVGTFSMTCTSPASTAATRGASCGRMRSVTFSHGVLPPHHASLRASSMRSPLA